MIAWVRAAASRLLAVFRKQHLDREFDEELRDHLDLLTAEYQASGLAPGEARRAALLKLGHPEQLREDHRDRRGVPVLEALAQDLRFALRTLWKSRGFTAIAALSLALGIGANTALFSLVDTLLLRQLSVREPERLVTVRRVFSADGITKPMALPATMLASVRALHAVYADVMGYKYLDRPIVKIDGALEPNRAVEQVTDNFFRGLGLEPVIGRSENDAPAAVISFRIWKTRFDGNPNALGRVLNVDGQLYPIIGVAPERFAGLSLDASTDVWLLSPMAGPFAPWMIARLQPGVAVTQAQAATEVLFRQMDLDPGSMARRMPPRMVLRTEVISAARGLSFLRVQYERPLLALMVLVTLVLLITCTNIGNLLVVRNTGRVRELTVRAALGARRSRLITQLLVESTVLAAVGGTLAWVVARWGVSAILAMLPLAEIPQQLEFRMDARMLGFTTAISLLSALLFALAPAWRATHVDLIAGLKAAPGKATPRDTRRLGRWLVAGQIALSVVLLTGACLFLQTLRNLARTDPGFDARNLLQVEIDTRGAGYRQGQVRGVVNLLLERLSAISGVQTVTCIRNPVLGGISITLMPHGNTQVTVHSADVGPRFFETMRVPLVRGRFFSAGDLTRSQPVAVVSEMFGKEMFPGEDVLGKKIGNPAMPVEVVGVVKDTRFAGIRADVRPMLYTLALRNEPDRMSGIDIRISGDATAVVRAIQQAVTQVNPRLLLSIKTMQEMIDSSIAQERMVAATSGFFGMLGLVLAGIGLFGVASFTVAQRTSELGIRIALGAGRWDVIRESLRDTALVLGLGIVVGGSAAVAAARLAGSLISGLLFGLKATDWTSIAGAGLLMCAVAIAACMLPALKAVRVDPLEAIRYE